MGQREPAPVGHAPDDETRQRADEDDEGDEPVADDRQPAWRQCRPEIREQRCSGRRGSRSSQAGLGGLVPQVGVGQGKREERLEDGQRRRLGVREPADPIVDPDFDGRELEPAQREHDGERHEGENKRQQRARQDGRQELRNDHVAERATGTRPETACGFDASGVDGFPGGDGHASDQRRVVERVGDDHDGERVPLDERDRPQSENSESLIERSRPAEHRVETHGDHDPRQHEREDRQRTQRSPAPELVVREDVGGGQPQRDARDRRQRGLIRGKAEQPLADRRYLESEPRDGQRNAGKRGLERHGHRNRPEPAAQRLEVRSHCQRLRKDVREDTDVERIGEDRAEERKRRRAVVDHRLHEDDADRQVEHNGEDARRDERRQRERAALEPAAKAGGSPSQPGSPLGPVRSRHGLTGWRTRAPSPRSSRRGYHEGRRT